MLKEKTLFGDIDKVKKALNILKELEPKEGYYLAFSGGKDSIVIKELVIMAGVKYDAHYSVTTIDPPELIYYIKQYHSDVIWERPDVPFLTRLIKKGFPIRQQRWCCGEYKERGGSGRLVITGIRKAESNKRSGRNMIESCYKDGTKRFLNIIIDWSDADVWEFIRKQALPYCKLYDEGWNRIGCLFCPMAYYKTRLMEANRYPKYRDLFIKSFIEYYAYKKKLGSDSISRWKDGEDMFWWWIGDMKQKHENIDQFVMFE